MTYRSVSVKRSSIMTDKQLINSVENCVAESLYGFSKLHSNLFVDLTRNVVLDENCCSKGRVALISGGGSGHEPFPAGYVGKGMLTASISGSVFTSPPSNHISHGIRLVAGKSSGVLLLVPNYTGDVLNFGLAAETISEEEATVESIVVGEDVAQEILGTVSKAGKRGMCGLVLVIKIAGYLAQTNHDLETIKKFTVEAVQSLASIGVCVSACCKPGVGLLFRLESDEMEVGVGVHGEAGVARHKMMSASEVIKMLLEYVIQSLKVAEGDEVVALVNNLGSLSYIEQWILAGELEKQLSAKNIKVLRLYAGCFFTSLNMAGAQICVLKLNRETKTIFLAALDYPTTAPAWITSEATAPIAPKEVAITSESKNTSSKGFLLSPSEAEFLKFCLLKISQELTKQKTYLNYLDTACGDGDCGTSFGHLAALLQASADTWDLSDPKNLFSKLSLAAAESIGGTTGALYALFFKRCSKELEKYENLNDASVFSKCWRAGVEVIKRYSSARLGDRTMLDSLETACQTFENQLERKSVQTEEAFRSAVRAAVEGCQSTKHLKARAGRASYTNRPQQKDFDAGAYAVVVWLSAIQSALEERQPPQTD